MERIHKTKVLKGKYNELCDMWLMGVILFVMVFGFPPFYSADGKDTTIFKNIKKGFMPKVQEGYGPWFPKAIPVSKGCKDLISRLLRTKMADRLTSEEALEHQYLKSNQNIDSDPIKKVMNSSILNSLKGFKMNNGSKSGDTNTGLQTQILGLLSKCNYLNNNQTKSVKEFFEAADKDGDGKITEDELYEALKQIDPDITKTDVQSILNAIDADNDGYMDYDELLSSRIARKLQSNEDRLRKVFGLLDFDKSGTISSNELKQALDAIDLDKLSEAKCQELIKECDKDGDGEIDFEEFIQLFCKL